MVNYIEYADVAGIMQKDMVDAIREEFPKFGPEQMCFACHPRRNALQLVPEAEEILVRHFGKGPGLSLSRKGRDHGNKKKPHRLYVRVNDSLRSQLQAVYEKMCFASMQDMLEAALGDFVRKYGTET